MSVKFKDNSSEVLAEFKQKKERGMKAIGEQAITHAKKDVPIDTGRLKNSITYATDKYAGVDNYSDDLGNNYSGGSAKEMPSTEVIAIGTNVEYAIYQEVKHHFLKNAAANHADEYKNIMTASLKA